MADIAPCGGRGATSDDIGLSEIVAFIVAIVGGAVGLAELLGKAESVGSSLLEGFQALIHAIAPSFTLPVTGALTGASLIIGAGVVILAAAVTAAISVFVVLSYWRNRCILPAWLGDKEKGWVGTQGCATGVVEQVVRI